MKNFNEKNIKKILLVTAVIFFAMIGLIQVKPPSVNVSSSKFPIFQQMMANIERWAALPHPSGSAEIDRVRAELIGEIEGMGLTPIVEDAPYTIPELTMAWTGKTPEELWELNKDWAAESYGVDNAYDWIPHMINVDSLNSLKNILVKLDAPGTDRGIMFVSHYDSVDNSPGAADAMMPVCAMLEAMRVHAQNNTLKNDIYFLFTDGEEMGLLGAWKFVAAHPELKDKIDMVINLEMRGNSGGVLLFESSPDSYQLMKTVINSGAKPIGMSWAVEVYRMMPNDTDLTVFLRNGYQGINFAGIEGVKHYHQPSDNFENLNRNTAWQYLHTVLAIADYAANSSLEDLRGSSKEAVFFPFLPGNMVLMTFFISNLICALACLGAIVYGIGQIKKGQFELSFSIVLLGILLLLSIASAIWFTAASYLFYIPLILLVLTKSLKKWSYAHLGVRVFSIMVVLLLWVPVVYLLWVSMVEPMML